MHEVLFWLLDSVVQSCAFVINMYQAGSTLYPVDPKQINEYAQDRLIVKYGE